MASWHRSLVSFLIRVITGGNCSYAGTKRRIVKGFHGWFCVVMLVCVARGKERGKTVFEHYGYRQEIFFQYLASVLKEKGRSRHGNEYPAVENKGIMVRTGFESRIALLRWLLLSWMDG